LTLLIALAGPVAAQGYRLPQAALTVVGGAATLRYGSVESTYVDGIGWLNGWPAPPPELRDGVVVVDGTLLPWLGVDLPRIEDIRSSGESSLRIVLDLGGHDPEALAQLERRGDLGAGQQLVLELPPTLLPVELPLAVGSAELAWQQDRDGTRLAIAAGAVRYSVDVLSSPTRVVIDLLPTAPPMFTPVDREVRTGARYRRFAYANGLGGSVVHALELDPGAGELRVVGESGIPRTLSELASGGYAAINGGYFDPDTFTTIGLLTVDRGLLSAPSRNRAALATGPDGVAIARVQANAELVVAGRSLHAAQLGEGWRLATGSGAQVGTPRDGVLTLALGSVVGNRIGPVIVPEGGSALIYDPALRALAAVEPGARAELRLSYRPRAFSGASYALEAGPLLVADGRPAFEPELEGFARGQRILDEITQQAAVGVRSDGTLLFVVAEAMTAEGLVPLLLALGAERAMRLDSGSSAGLLIDGELVNRPFERRLVTALVWVPSDTP
jgi:hypothetical protein